MFSQTHKLTDPLFESLLGYRLTPSPTTAVPIGSEDSDMEDDDFLDDEEDDDFDDDMLDDDDDDDLLDDEDDDDLLDDDE